MNKKDLEELELTDEELLDAEGKAEMECGSMLFSAPKQRRAIAQAQLSNVIKALTEEKDKPDSEGWWLFIFGDKGQYQDFVRLHYMKVHDLDTDAETVELVDQNLNIIKGYREGKWIKAFVPEGG